MTNGFVSILGDTGLISASSAAANLVFVTWNVEEEPRTTGTLQTHAADSSEGARSLRRTCPKPMWDGSASPAQPTACLSPRHVRVTSARRERPRWKA